MKVNLEKYAGKRICVAVSGGKDSMALLHYLAANAGKYDIALSALNCEHGIRGEESERDSAFVVAYCAGNGIFLRFFKAESGAFSDENAARKWRLDCYNEVLKSGEVDCIATAHHLNDNAETVLFNLARGAHLSGLCGIGDEPSLGLIRPLINCTREEIDCYIAQNDVPYVIDSTNLQANYTRNKIRLNVLPRLEEAVPGAAEAIFRFSRLAREDEEYFSRLAEGIISERGGGNFLIKPCAEKVIFKRAAAHIIADKFRRIDYTSEHMERLFALQSAQNGKKFLFCNLVAVKEEGGVAIAEQAGNPTEIPLAGAEEGKSLFEFAGAEVKIAEICGHDCKKEVKDGEVYLYFDRDKIPDGAVLRYRRAGDYIEKFGGGRISVSDLLTDAKIPQSMRDCLPLICVGSEAYVVGGVEISRKVKVTKESRAVRCFICRDPFGNGGADL